MNTKPEAMLVIGPSWVGDMVMAQSLFKLIKQYRPHVAIDVLAPAWSEPLLARMPEVREALRTFRAEQTSAVLAQPDPAGGE